MNRIATKILMALAAVAVPALAVAGVLGWMLITTVQEVGSDLEEALSTQRRVAQIRVLMEKESGLVFRLPSELDQAKIGEHAGRLGDLAKELDGEIEALAANRRVVTPEMMKSIAGNRAQAKSTTGKIIEAAKSFAQTVAVELASGPFEAGMSTTNVLLDAVSSNVDSIAESARENLKQSSLWAWWLAPVGFMAVLIALGLGLWMVRRSVVAPLTGITDGMGALAGGKFDIDVGGIERKDEIGQMARAVVIFRDAAVDKQRLEQETEASRRLAEDERRMSAEARTKAAEDQAAAQASAAEEQASVVRALASGLNAIAGGDLMFRLKDGFSEAYRQIKDDFNSTVTQLHDAIAVIASATREVATTTGEISSSTTDLSQRTEEQAASLEQTTSSMQAIAVTVRKNAESAQQASTVAGKTCTVADRGGEIVGRAVGAMARIEESSRKVADIIGVIDEIARQTNLLALNAAVEAARAGESGRGFAVVASEVRSLAQRSSQAAKDIKELITKSSGQVQEGVQLVNQAGASLNEIVGSIKEVAEIVSTIAAVSVEQSNGIAEVNAALNQMDQVTQQNSALVEENAAAAKSLERQSQAMEKEVRFFQVDAANRGETPHRAAA
jgi:methyl-accepting chemotaxis protein